MIVVNLSTKLPEHKQDADINSFISFNMRLLIKLTLTYQLSNQIKIAIKI